MTIVQPETQAKIALVQQAVGHAARNAGMPLDLEWIAQTRVNQSATDRRVISLPGRRSVKKDAQAAWLLKALTCIDLTTLSGDDTAGRPHRRARGNFRPRCRHHDLPHSR